MQSGHRVCYVTEGRWTTIINTRSSKLHLIRFSNIFIYLFFLFSFLFSFVFYYLSLPIFAFFYLLFIPLIFYFPYQTQPTLRSELFFKMKTRTVELNVIKFTALTFVKYVGCFQDIVYQNLSHIYNVCKEKLLHFKCLTFIHLDSFIQKWSIWFFAVLLRFPDGGNFMLYITKELYNCNKPLKNKHVNH
jgi:hypothetical protein